MNTTLTAHETKVLTAIAAGKFEFFDDGFNEGSNAWTDCLTDDIVSLLGVTPQGAGGVISSLIQKGLFQADGTGRDSAVYLTETAINYSL